jgi:hypothetical protein
MAAPMPLVEPVTTAVIVVAPHEPDQRLVVYTVSSDSSTARLRPILASWDAAAATY